MFSKILSLLQSLCKAIAWWHERGEKKEREAISEAVHTGDAEKVDALNQEILKESLRLLPLGFFLGMSLFLPGCSFTRTVYVPDSAKAVPMEHEGVPGWWEPNSLYEAKLLILHEHVTNCHKD